MSGIFGIASSRQIEEIGDNLDAMGDAMSHGAWHVVENAVILEDRAGLGRIGIGVFNANPQPVWNPGRTVAVVLAGEVYDGNQPDAPLNEPDILALYAQFGSDLPRHIQGAFILGFWDTLQRQLVIMNDRFGLYPLYYAHYNQKLIFGPEMKAILQDGRFHRAIDYVALAEYARFQTLLGEKTFFEDLYLLRNASVLTYDLMTDQLSTTTYWDFSNIPELPGRLTLEDAAHEEGRLLKAAVTRLSQGNYRLGLYLSAGLDSRVLAGFMPPHRLPLNTVTFGLRNSRDVVYAQRLANLIGSKHHYFEFTDGRWVAEYADLHLTLTEGFHSWIHAHGISILSQTRQLMEVNLTGLGGGLIDWEDMPLLGAQNEMAFMLRLYELMSQKTSWPSLTDAEERALYTPAMQSKMGGLAYDSMREELANYENLPFEKRAAAFSICNADRRMYQYYTVFHRAYIEQRFPFFDYAYLDFVQAVPVQYLFKRQMRRTLILKFMPELAGVPYDKDDLPITGGGIKRVGAKLAKRAKRYTNRRFKGLFSQHTTLYADYENWLRGDLYDWGAELMLGHCTQERGIFNPLFMQALWERHQSGLEVNIIGKLAPLMTWEMLARRFLD